MKPDWKGAPEWANWLAMDGDGMWFWHEYEPEFVPAHGVHLGWWKQRSGGRKQYAMPVSPASVNTLEVRP